MKTKYVNSNYFLLNMNGNKMLKAYYVNEYCLQ